ncbi:MAG: efflux RND transporter periplasmic adaptor subunit, partial [Nitrospirae bacterium]
MTRTSMPPEGADPSAPNAPPSSPAEPLPSKKSRAFFQRPLIRFAVLGIIAIIAGGLLYRFGDLGIRPSQQESSRTTKPTPPSVASQAPSAPPHQPQFIRVSAERRQLIGVETASAEQRSLTRSIRTVGLVEVDERLLAHVHIKLSGWVEKLYVRFVGEQVDKGQKLFEIYSPDLVATQEEYLLALKAVRTLGSAEFPEVAESAKRVLESTRQRFALWDITPDHIRDLERTGTVLRTLPLHAPISGYVLDMQMREGMYVTPNLDLYTLADLSKVWVLADLYEYEIPYIELGQEATITLPYFPGEVFHGTVTYIYPVLEPKTRTVKVRFELPNPQWRLKPGMFANVDILIPLGVRLVVPATAVLDSGTEQLVFVDHGNGLFEP